MITNLMFLCLYLFGGCLLLMIACLIEYLYFKWLDKKSIVHYHMRDRKWL